MNIPMKYEDVVANLDAAEVIIQAVEHVESHLEKQIDILRIDLNASMARESALREELEESDEENSNLREVIRDIKNWREVSQSSAALSSLLKQADEIAHKPGPLQQRLTVAEQRAGVMEKALMRIARPHDCGCLPCTGDCTSKLSLEITVDCMRDTAEAALKPAAKPHKCIECDSQYCHGVCVERGDDDERYKGAEGEWS